MQTLDGFRSRHLELKEIIADLQPLLDAERLKVKPNAEVAYRLLCDLADKLKTLLAEEDKGLYPSLLIHHDPKVKSLAWGFIAGERPVRQLFNAYCRRWLKDCNFQFDAEFLGETHDIIALTLERLAREEQHLFPKLQEIGVYGEAGLGAHSAVTASARPGRF
jgi:hypothetical protein